MPHGKKSPANHSYADTERSLEHCQSKHPVRGHLEKIVISENNVETEAWFLPPFCKGQCLLCGAEVQHTPTWSKHSLAGNALQATCPTGRSLFPEDRLPA